MKISGIFFWVLKSLSQSMKAATVVCALVACIARFSMERPLTGLIKMRPALLNFEPILGSEAAIPVAQGPHMML